MARTVANQVPVGWRVESQSDYQAVMVRGRPVNHVLHLILTIITCSWWGLVWISLVFFGGERRLITNVDEWGNILTSRLDSRRAKVIAAVALSIVGGFWLLVLVVVIAGIEDGTTSAAPTYVPYGGETPVPTPTPIPVERVDAEAILSDYNSNEAAADAQWRGRWLLVSVRGIDDIDNEGRVRKFGDLFDDSISLDFVDINDVVPLLPGQDVTAVCRLDGYSSFGWLNFEDCRIETGQ